MGEPNVAKPKKPILGDHQRIGKRFIPPFAKLGFTEISWVETLLPELLWLGLLNDHHGLAKGADLAITLARAAVSTWTQERKKLFAASSSFTALDRAQQKAVVASLASSGHLDDIQAGLVPLPLFYPECPLNFIFEQAPAVPDAGALLARFKESLDRQFDRWDKPATMVQANMVYIAFVTDVLKVMKGLSLANFPAIETFPETEESKRVASAVRCTVSSFFAPPHYDNASPWPRYFWSQGFSIEPCSLEHLA